MSHVKQRLQQFSIQPFRWYVLSCLLATFGTGLFYINTTWLALHNQDSIGSVAGLMIMFWVPVVLFGPVAGVVADRVSRKKIIIVSDLCRAMMILVFLVLWVNGFAVTQTLLYSVVFLQGVFFSFALPAYMAYIREIVSEAELLYANFTVDIAYEVGNVIGMGMAGLIIALTSMQFSFVINMLSFILAAICVLIAKSTSHIEASDGKPWWLKVHADYRDGLRYLRDNGHLTYVYLIQLVVMVMFMTSPVLLAPFAKNVLHANVGQFGDIEAAMSSGVVIGGLLTPWLSDRFGQLKTLGIGLVLLLLSYVLFSRVMTITESEVMYFIIGLSLSIWPLMLTLAQSVTDLDFQGRVQSTFNSISGIAILLMYALLGLEGSHFSFRVMYLFEAFFAVIGLVLFFLYWRQTCKKT